MISLNDIRDLGFNKMVLYYHRLEQFYEKPKDTGTRYNKFGKKVITSYEGE